MFIAIPAFSHSYIKSNKTSKILKQKRPQKP
jgi:hypothetical protein